jgi:hypothetical protein
MNRSESTESVGSVTSAMANLRIFEENAKVNAGEENERLRDILSDRLTEIKALTETVEKLKHDADCWKFAKNQYFRQLNFVSAVDFEEKIKIDMSRSKDISELIKSVKEPK